MLWRVGKCAGVSSGQRVISLVTLVTLSIINCSHRSTKSTVLQWSTASLLHSSSTSVYSAVFCWFICSGWYLYNFFLNVWSSKQRWHKSCNSHQQQSPLYVHAYTGWSKKRIVFRLDNFVTVSPRKACSMSKFSKFYLEKRYNSHFSEFKYSLPDLLKSSQQLKLCYIWPEHMDFTQFTLTYSETTVIFPQS